jgi:SAM-dependent methyltransferase
MKSIKAASRLAQLRPVHPFPARMAPEIALSSLKSPRKLRVLDPMAGSGTSIILARILGHTAIGYDQDPLALLIARTWCSKPNETVLREALASTVSAAKARWKTFEPYPRTADIETRRFVRYWFDLQTRKKLAALAAVICEYKHQVLRTQLWCTFSRLIIVKDNGVSLARDVSHSRPHRSYECAPADPFVLFSRAGEYIIKSLLALPKSAGSVRLEKADARNLPIRTASVDLVITSPPYLNAIDYLRGHKMSLVWMGHSIRELRALRNNSVGAEIGRSEIPDELQSAKRAIGRLPDLHPRIERMVNKYIVDMNFVIAEIARVLRPQGKAVVVVGNSTLRGAFLRNSDLIIELGRLNGLSLTNRQRRRIPLSRRYLPPPSSQASTMPLASRMRTEVVLTLQKPDARLGDP